MPQSLRPPEHALAVMILTLFLVSCAAAQPPAEPVSELAPEFFRGFWHGFIAPIAFVVSLFVETVRIYQFPNAGLWYDFGFMLGISGFSGGVFAGSRKK